MRLSRVGMVGVLLMSAAYAAADSDFQWAFNNAAFLSYTITAVSSPRVYDGSLGAGNPGLTLIVGKRYEVTVVNSGAHPFQVLAKGSGPGSDVVLLSMSSTAGTLQTDPDINWTNDNASSNGKVDFTVTPALVTAMFSNGNSPGYRCSVHTSTMRGDFMIVGAPLANPIPGHIPAGESISLQTVATGMSSPIGAVWPDDGTNRMFVYDQVGQIWIVDNGTRLATPFLDVAGRMVAVGQIPGFGGYDERGLIGLAFHPDFAHHPQIYTYTSEPVAGVADFTVPVTTGYAMNCQSVIAEWTVNAANANLIDPASRHELLRFDKPYFNHNGGTLRFGPDGDLYIATGDGGNADDQGEGHGTGNGQNLNSILGKLLRINVDGVGNASANGKYNIPTDNPFVAGGGLAEIFAYGLRNPYAYSFDSDTGDLYLGDVGQNNIEEVDKVVKGGNYGWNVKEGSFFFNPNGALDGFATDQPVVDPVPPNLIDPIANYDHDEGIAVIAGHVYHGADIPALAGRFIFGDLGKTFAQPSGRLFYLDASNVIRELQIPAPGMNLFVKGFGQDPQGNIYVCGSGDIGAIGTAGVVLKILPPASSTTPPTADLAADKTSGTAPLVVQFTDESTAGTSPITTWAWTFGDGGTSNATNPKHTYMGAGTYTVVLTVTTVVGSNTATKTGYIAVQAAPSGCFGGTVDGLGAPATPVRFTGDAALWVVLLILFAMASRVRIPAMRTSRNKISCGQ